MLGRYELMAGLVRNVLAVALHDPVACMLQTRAPKTTSTNGSYKT